MASGTVMWLCPTTWYCVKELYGIFEELNGEPVPAIFGRYPLFARRLVKLHWTQKKAKEGRNGR